MKIQLSDHFTYGKLFRFTFPSIIMMVFTSIYSVVDGFFCIKFCWKNSVCFHQFNNAISHYSRKPWLYDWNRWYSARLPYSWRGR